MLSYHLDYIKETEIKRKVDELKGKINGFDDELTKQGMVIGR